MRIECFCVIAFALSVVQAFHVRQNTGNYRTPPEVRVTVFYEALCPACTDYIKNQFYPAYEKFWKYWTKTWNRESGPLGLVPYGNTQTNGTDSKGELG